MVKLWCETYFKLMMEYIFLRNNIVPFTFKKSYIISSSNLGKSSH